MIKPSIEFGNGKWGGKDNFLLAYSEGETSNKFLPRHMQFRRDGDVSGTRTLKNDIVEKGRRNLLRGSNRFGEDGNATLAPWAKSGIATINDGFEGYDGTKHAWKLTKNGKYGRVQQVLTATSAGTKTLSVYAKGEAVSLRAEELVNNAYVIRARAVYELNGEGSVVFEGTNTNVMINTSITHIKDGWYRVSLTYNTNTDLVRIYPAVIDEPYEDVNSGVLYLQDAQLEDGHSATDYIETGSLTNLLSDSNRFDMAGTDKGMGWFKTKSVVERTTVTAYDGTNEAWLLKKSGSGTYGRIHQVTTQNTGKTRTFSLYGKKGSVPGIHIRLDEEPGAGNLYASFNLETGELIEKDSDGDLLSATITAVGNDGWYRMVMTVSDTQAIELVRFGPADATGDTSAATGTIYIKDAQLEDGDEATTYSDTKSRAGLMADEPRIDYSRGSWNLLVEPKRTNLVQYSEGIKSIAGYNNTSATHAHVTLASDEINPMGYKGGVVKCSNLLAAAGDRNYFKAPTVATRIYTASFYIKGTEGETIRYYAKRIQVNNEAIGSVGNNTQELTLTGKWQRVEHTFDATSTLGGAFLVARKTGGADDSTADTVHIWGFQIEVGYSGDNQVDANFATSYIPNYGTSAGVTRIYDEIQSGFRDISDFHKGEDYTVFMEFAENRSLKRDNSGGGVRVSADNATSDSVRVYRASSSATTHHVVWFDNTGTDSNAQDPAPRTLGGGSPPTGSFKVAIRRKYSNGKWDVIVNGTHEYDPAINDQYGAHDQIMISGQGSTHEITTVQLFDSLLSIEECKTLTS